MEEREERQVRRVKALLREYHQTKSEEAKREFEEVNALYPFVFSRAFLELRQERGRAGPRRGRRRRPAVPAPVGRPRSSTRSTRACASRSSRSSAWRQSCPRTSSELKAQGRADDILLQTVRKRLGRARDNLYRKDSADFAARRLEVTRNSLVTTWRQVRAILPPGLVYSPSFGADESAVLML